MRRPIGNEPKLQVIDNPVPKSLDGRDNTGRKHAPSQDFKIASQGPEGTAAEITEEPTLELEEDPQHLGNGEDHLAMRNIQKELLPLFRSWRSSPP
jgi:hypothetical protein